MTFLKVVVSVITTVVLLMFLGNLSGVIFQPSGKTSEPSEPAGIFSYSSLSGSTDVYKSCEKLQPTYAGVGVDSSDYNSSVYKVQIKKYQDCLTKARTEQNDQKAQSMMSTWIRAAIVLLTLTALAVVLFKKFPFFATSLIAAGVLFLIIHPSILATSLWDYLSQASELSQSVRNQMVTIKTIISGLGFIVLAVADIFFFEKVSNEIE